MKKSGKPAEVRRLQEAREGVPWKKWGPYLSERQWGTVREDYSDDGDAWNYFSHDQARSRAYRWGEDGLAGISDEAQRLCFALALFNGRDPIIKERLFGLTNAEGNHGEDVKEYYYYLDNTPTHSYMKYLYKYPQSAYPYDDLVATNKSRTRYDLEYELVDTGVFDTDRYFDVFVEYAKESPETIFARISICNRGAEAAQIHVLPTLWFRNTWSWKNGSLKPSLTGLPPVKGMGVVRAVDTDGSVYYLYYDDHARPLFTENETNRHRIFRKPNLSPHVKDAINDYIVSGRIHAVNPEPAGTKVSFYSRITIEAGSEAVIRLALSSTGPEGMLDVFEDRFQKIFQERMREADEFYRAITPPSVQEDAAMVMRQALAGMLWSKQYYCFDIDTWLEEHGAHPLSAGKRQQRNRQWYHMMNKDIISMPDKWEYPWYAAWDLAFHTCALSMVDPDFSKQQLDLMLSEVYLHPNGQIPAYEWNFSDVNPPVHAWATLFNYSVDRQFSSQDDVDYLKSAFQKLLLNFTWWVNRKDAEGNNLFEGGFLGLDNIGVFDRSSELPSGGRIEQADGTAWMAFYCQTMFELALELSLHDPSYEDMALKFLEHFLWIAGSMDRLGLNADELWDEDDGFFYDLLIMPGGQAQRIKVRSLVGLLPLCATTVIPRSFVERYPRVLKKAQDFINRHEELVVNIHRPEHQGVEGRRLLAVLNETKLRRVLVNMLDEDRFLSPHGIRSLSRWHRDNPYILNIGGREYRVEYLPAESDSGMFGGNSNWRGPVWMPVNLLIIRALMQFYQFYGDGFTIECPTGSGKTMNLFEVAREIAMRLVGIFLKDSGGRRPVFGDCEKFQSDPNWRDNILFYEYFHGDNGAGIGASHQTGWTGVVAKLIQLFGFLNAGDALHTVDKPFNRVYYRP